MPIPAIKRQATMPMAVCWKAMMTVAATKLARPLNPKNDAEELENSPASHQPRTNIGSKEEIVHFKASAQRKQQHKLPDVSRGGKSVEPGADLGRDGRVARLCQHYPPFADRESLPHLALLILPCVLLPGFRAFRKPPRLHRYSTHRIEFPSARAPEPLPGPPA